MYRAAKRDSNEAHLIEAARAVGATVKQLDDPGVADLLIGFDGKNYLVEVKSESGTLTAAQEKFFAEWKGQVCVARTADDITRLLLPEIPRKWCSRGKHFRPLSEFSAGRGKFHKQSWCKACFYKYYQEKKHQKNSS